MKRFTKKMIGEQPSFILAIDWLVSVRNDFTYETFFTDDIIQAMTWSETFFTSDVYMITLFERTNTVKDDALVYVPRLSSRTCGQWHIHDEAHCEYTGAVLAWYPDAGFACHVARD